MRINNKASTRILLCNDYDKVHYSAGVRAQVKIDKRLKHGKLSHQKSSRLQKKGASSSLNLHERLRVIHIKSKHQSVLY